MMSTYELTSEIISHKHKINHCSLLFRPIENIALTHRLLNHIYALYAYHCGLWTTGYLLCKINALSRSVQITG